MLHIHHFPSCRVFHEAEFTCRRAAEKLTNTRIMLMDTTAVVFKSTLKPTCGFCQDITNPNYPFSQEIGKPFSAADSPLEEEILPSNRSNQSENVAPDENFNPTQSNNSDIDDEVSVGLKVSFTTDQKWTVALLKLLDEIQAPDFAFGKILNWGCEAARDKYSFYPQGGLERNKQIDLLFNFVENAKDLLPAVCPVPTVDANEGYITDVIAYDFVPQLLSLLQNRNIMIEENLLLDVSDPLKPFEGPGQVRGEAISGLCIMMLTKG